MTHRPYHKSALPVIDRLRKVWVSLADGDLCCWELTGQEMALVAERSQKPAVAGGGISESTASAWMAAIAARTTDDSEARRVWDDTQLGELLSLPMSDYAVIQDGVRKACGLDPDDLERLKDFTRATEAPKPSDCKSSASSNSTGSPPSATSLTTS